MGCKVEHFFEDLQKLSVTGESSEEFENDLSPTQHQRMCLEISRNFMRISDSNHQLAVHSLVKSLTRSLPPSGSRSSSSSPIADGLGDHKRFGQAGDFKQALARSM